MKLLFKNSQLLIAIASFLAQGCSSTTRINSVPKGAKVYIDDQYKGVTPYDYSDTKIVGSPTRIRLVKEGYEEFHTTIQRSESFQPCACAGGVVFLVPFLWIMGYNPDRTYEMNKE